MIRALLHKIAHANARLCIFTLQDIFNIENPSEKEIYIANEHRQWEYYNNKDRIDELRPYYDDIYDNDEIIYEVYGVKKYIHMPMYHGGINLLPDVKSKFYNVVNNCRVTTDIPEQHVKNIFMFGSCIGIGAFAEDRHTCASFLQRMLNKSFPNTFRVTNCSNWCSFADTARQIVSPRYAFSQGDIVIIITNNVEKKSLLYEMSLFIQKYFALLYDATHIFNRPHCHGDVILDSQMHMCHRGYNMLASYIFQKIHAIVSADDVQFEFEQSGYEYLHKVKILSENVPEKMLRGAVVINCNPFTLGHRYLIEQALRQCDHLFIFVVEEDKSQFSFHDRFAMVKQATHDIKNITVIPSGEMIASSCTLPEYFTKEDKNILYIDPNKDVTLFASVIAPVMHIKKRFAGTEPYCSVTRQYNEGMKTILPRYGVEFIEIPRKEGVSASFVRNALAHGAYDKAKALLPESVYEYLEKNNLLGMCLGEKNDANTSGTL